MKHRLLAPVLAVVGLWSCLGAPPPAVAQAVGRAPAKAAFDAPLANLDARDAERRVLRALARKNTWDGPTSGPHAQPGKTVVFIAADMKNGGVAGVARGVEEAAKAIGWTVQLIDGQGSAQGRSAALNQALGHKPQGLLLGGFDATEQAALLRQAAAARIPVVGWHAGREASGVEGLFYNVTTNARDVAQVTALYAVMQAGGKPGVVIFTDSNYAVALAKSDIMANVIRQCKSCTLLGVEDTALATAAQRMPAVVASLRERHGDKWTVALGINDLYFDFMVPAPGVPLAGLSAGDGSPSAYGRVRASQIQVGTVPEPLNLHGWQLVDELNRALAGQAPSGYSTPVHLVTPQTIVFDGGPGNSFEPGNGYRDEYRRIWAR